jgi:hypothetical protein
MKEGKAKRLGFANRVGRWKKNWKKAEVRRNLSCGIEPQTWTSFVGGRIDVRLGREVAVSPSINVRKENSPQQKGNI